MVLMLVTTESSFVALLFCEQKSPKHENCNSNGRLASYGTRFFGGWKAEGYRCFQMDTIVHLSINVAR